jgi:NAD(P)-dependent dehydrogenase (short-subunit alcohol dehydrogenase family)
LIIDLTGKKAIITGSSDGIGFACAQGFAEAGADVVITGRSNATVERALDRLRTEFPKARFGGVVAELSNGEGPARIIEAAPHCDILVNNCAVNILQDVLEQPDDVYFRLFEINVLAALRLTRHYLPLMLRKNWGRVLFHNSEQALRPSPNMAAYGATKAAELALARSVAEYTRGTAVTVNTIMIGPTRSAVTSAFHARLAAESGKTVKEIEEDFFRNVRPASLLQRLAEGREVANMAVYLSSDYASATNGAALSVEGGVREVVF